MNNPLKILSNSPDQARFSVRSGGDTPQREEYAGNAAVVTLGCAKNLVDSEVMLGVLRESGYQIVSELEQADVAIVNTCSFLQSAVRESLDSVLEAADYKRAGRLRKLVVAGCLVGRYGSEELAETLPEVDAFLSGEELLDVGRALSGELGSVLREGARPYFLYDDTTPRIRSTSAHTTYIKISEGCNRPCTFCIIPEIRGGLRSRALQSVVTEVSALALQGVREFNLVGQDLTAYGSDRKTVGESITELLREVSSAVPEAWIRLLYAYPLGISAELLKTIQECEAVCNYLDIPLQHASEAVLRRMKRPLGKYSPQRLVPFMREHAPAVRLRTTFIVGFPGETEQDIDELVSFVEAGWFSSVGVFTYSQEEGTPAGELDGQLSEEVKQERRHRVLEAQKAVLAGQEADHIGRTYRVLVDGAHADTDLLLTGRTAFQAPEVDGTVLINELEDESSVVTPGNFYDVEITDVHGYDLVGKLLA